MAKKKISFEDAVSRMEEIVNILESDEVSLEKSINLYKEGMELSLICREILKTAEKEVMLLQKNAENEFFEEPFHIKEE